MAKQKKEGDATKVSPLSKYTISVMTAAIAAVMYYFWAIPFRAALNYREQLQLFQTTGAYFSDLAGRPGGVATYIGEFLTQFFNNYWIGAAIMSALLIAVLLLSYAIIRRFAPAFSKWTAYLLAIIPSASLFLYFGDSNVLLTFAVALILSLSAAASFAVYAGNRLGISLTVIAIVTTLLYWLAGPATIIYTLLSVALPLRKKPLRFAATALTAIGVVALNIIVWYYLTPGYPLSYQLIGIGYLLNPDTLTAGQVIVEAACVLTPLIAVITSGLPRKIVIPSLVAAEVAAIVLIYPKAYDSKTYTLINYDYLVRINDWDGILRYSDKNDPDLPLSVSATNLALGMTGQLDSRAFSYFQNGPEGLIPSFSKETLSSWTTGEIFFQLGLINSAQRFYFEGMEAIPNYNKSARAIRRMAETAMIRGDYQVAEKYLHLLENTLFYRKWAKRNLELIETDGVESHPLYGALRSSMPDESYMFSEGELDKTLGQLFLIKPDNNLAKQYLIVYPLLQRDLNKFVQYMGVVAEQQPTYNPPLAQQVMAFMAMKNGSQIPPGAVAPGIEQQLRDFAMAWTSKDPARIAPFRRSLFHYLLSD